MFSDTNGEKPREEILNIFGRKIKCSIVGNGDVPCVFVGAAGLFKKTGNLPKEMKDVFTIYFADTFDETYLEYDKSNKKMTWDFLVDEIEEVRKQLGLDKIAVFGQSAAGGIAFKYAQKYPETCLLAMIFNFSPIWTEKSIKETDKYIDSNASEERDKMIKIDRIKKLATDKNTVLSPEKKFISLFEHQKALFWKDFGSESGFNPKQMWEGYSPDVAKVGEYLTNVLNGFDIRTEKIPDTPILWVLGMYDYSVPYYLLTEDCSQVFDNKNITYYISDSGHYPMIENTEEFMRVLTSFVESQGIDYGPRTEEKQMLEFCGGDRVKLGFCGKNSA